MTHWPIPLPRHLGALLTTVALVACASGPAPPRAPRRFDSVTWAHRTGSDPVTLLVDRADAFVVGPTWVGRYRVATGRRVWRTRIDAADPSIAVLGRYVVVDGVDALAVLERRTGRMRRTHAVADLADDPRDTVGTVALTRRRGHPLAVVTTTAGAVVGLDPASGRVAWRVRLGGTEHGAVGADPARGVAVVARHHGDHVTVSVIDTGSGRVRWAVDEPLATAAPLLDGDQVVVGTGRVAYDGSVRAYDLVSGAPRWVRTTEGSFGPGLALTRDAGRVLALDDLGVLTALDRATGAVEWRTPTDLAWSGRPVVAGDAIALRTVWAQLFVLDRATGALRGYYRTAGVPVALAGGAGRFVLAQGQVSRVQLAGLSHRLMAPNRSSLRALAAERRRQAREDRRRDREEAEWARSHPPVP